MKKDEDLAKYVWIELRTQGQKESGQGKWIPSLDKWKWLPVTKKKITNSIIKDSTTNIVRARLKAQKDFMYIKEWKQ